MFQYSNLFNYDLSFNYKNLQKEYDTIKDTYKSDKIFQFNPTLIEDILDGIVSNIPLNEQEASRKKLVGYKKLERLKVF